MSRNEFLERRAYYQKQSDFTPKEKKELTFQEQNFVRGIQIVREKQKNDAIRHYKRIRKKARAQVKALSIEIHAFYDKPDILAWITRVANGGLALETNLMINPLY